MDHGACSVIYLDRRAHPERLRRDNVLASLNARDARGVVSSPGYFNFGRSISTQEVLSNVETLLSIFHESTCTESLAVPAHPMLTALQSTSIAPAQLRSTASGTSTTPRASTTRPS